MPRARWILLSTFVLLPMVAVPAGLAAQTAATRLREPLPIDAALSMRSHNGRSPVDLSPDGEWLAHTISTADTVPRDSMQYAATGFPFAEGDSRMEATLTHTRTGETVRLGGATSSSWAAAWSPDGTRVAFYSDEGGQAGLWIWELATRRATRFPDILVRPFFGFEAPRWSGDGERLLVKLVPEGLTITDMNALGPQRSSAPSRFAPVEPGEPSVAVRRVLVDNAEVDEPAAEDPVDPSVRQPPAGEIAHTVADLAVIDLGTHSVERMVVEDSVRYYAFSADGTQVAYSVLKGYEPATQQPNYDLRVHGLVDGRTRQLATNVRLGYGIEWSWSPDGAAVAYIPSGQLARRSAVDGVSAVRLVMVTVADGSTTVFESSEAPTFDPGDGEYPPVWSVDGSAVYAIGDGDLWRIDRASRQIQRVAGIADWNLRGLVWRPHDHTVWSGDDGATLWAVARRDDGSESGIFAIDPETGGSEAVLQQPKSYSAIFNLDASDVSGEIVFVATGQQELYDLWLLGTRDGQLRQASRLNPDVQRYELGSARVIDWRSLDGELLRGALLLPPGYRDGDRLPLVVWVYAGSMGSTYVNRFGFMGSLAMFNMHVLATRGYAVLFPDAPVRVGSPMTDLMSTVMPGVNAAIDLGYADPERLAVMGQSYGSYNTLGIITQTTRFKAAVITAAVLHPDLFADYLGGTGYYEEGQGNMGGSIWEYPDRYRDNSPLFRFDRIETPLLIGQGENDGDLVPAEAIFSALERLGKPVEYRLYEDEGHVLTQPANVRDFWTRRLEFLAEHLDLEVGASGAVRVQ